MKWKAVIVSLVFMLTPCILHSADGKLTLFGEYASLSIGGQLGGNSDGVVRSNLDVGLMAYITEKTKVNFLSGSLRRTTVPFMGSHIPADNLVQMLDIMKVMLNKEYSRDYALNHVAYNYMPYFDDFARVNPDEINIYSHLVFYLPSLEFAMNGSFLDRTSEIFSIELGAGAGSVLDLRMVRNAEASEEFEYTYDYESDSYSTNCIVGGTIDLFVKLKYYFPRVPVKAFLGGTVSYCYDYFTKDGNVTEPIMLYIYAGFGI